MVLTRSQADQAELEERLRAERARAAGQNLNPNQAQPPLAYTDAPRSPSDLVTVQAPAPTEIPTERRDEAPPTTSGRRVAFHEGQQRHHSPAASVCSSNTALRMRQAEREAEEKLLELRRKELDIEFEKRRKELDIEIKRQLIRTQLASQLDIIEAEGSQRGSIIGEPAKQQYLTRWIDSCVNTVPSAPTEPSTTTRTNMNPPNLNPPNPNPPNPNPPNPNPPNMDPANPILPAAIQNPPNPPQTTNPWLFESTPRREPRGRDRTPNAESRATSSSRAIELLAECIDKMSHNRPPPRQLYELPTFSGAAGEWLPFEAAFEQSTQAYRFTPSENVARLRSCLKGAAREAVAPLLHTATDPVHIIRTLKQCYGRPEVIVDRAIEDLKKLPRVGTSAMDLNTFAVKVQNVVCVLKSVDNQGYLYNPMLKREILDRLSPHMRSRYGDYAATCGERTEPEITMLSRFLMREADQALRFTYTGGASTHGAPAPVHRDPLKTAPRPAPRKSASWSAPKTNPVFATTTEEGRCCLCCGGHHEVPKCERVQRMDVARRWDWAKAEKVCFKCLSSRHRREECRARPCGIDGCYHSHHPLLHATPAPRTRAPLPDPDPAPRTRALSEPDPAPRVAPRTAPSRAPAPSRTAPRSTPALSQSSDMEEHAVMTTQASNRVFLKVCPVTIRGPRGAVQTFALLDDGSTVTLMDEELAAEIGATGPTVPLQVRGIGGANSQPRSQRIQVDIRGQGDVHRITARTIPNLSLHQQTLNKEVLQLKHLRDLGAASYAEATPRLLIGADNWHIAIVKESRVGRRSEPAAVNTELGWVIYGTIPRALTRDCSGEVSLYIRETTRHDARLDELVKTHFDIDALGVSLAVKERPADERACQIFEKTVAYRGSRYEVGLPWKNDDVSMPASYGVALERLHGVERKMRRDPIFAEAYSEQMNNLFKKNYATPVEGAELSSPRAWVLPHFAVKNVNKPEKIRLVFDAASRSQGRCLNDFLLDGPDLLRSLPGILFRFREGRYAVTADIQEMFLQIKIRPEDQPSQMFLWREPGQAGPPRLYKMTSLIFGASSSPFLAHSVRNHNADRHAEEFPQARDPIRRNHYMDDYVDSYATEEEAVAVATAVAEVHGRAGFNLRSWSTNSAQLREQIKPELRAMKPAHLGPDDGQKILGLCWSPDLDTLGFNTSMNRVAADVRTGLRAPTKREALSAVMSIYDPLGLLSPYTVTAKVILQDLWRKNLPWDEQLPHEDERAFARWLRGLEAVAALRLPRNYTESTGGVTEGRERRELHVFVDASAAAYATAAYFRTTKEDGEACVTLVAGKAKVAPLKHVSIPRLELQAAVIGARLASNILKEHRLAVDEVVYWTDSRTVLLWIRNNAKRYTPFVAHRLGEIAELTEPEQWRWVPTALNVADDATRPGGMEEPQATDRWFTGPAFLLAEPNCWPTEEAPAPEQNVIEEVCCATRLQKPWLPEVVRFSNYERLIRATARVLQFADILLKRKKNLEVEHLERAEKLLMLQSQEDSFQEELKNLRAGKAIARSSRIYNLDPVLEDELIRVRGRINAAPVPTHTKRPVILDGHHPLTKLLVLQEHYRAGHETNERVVNDLRQRYWVVNLRPTVRAVARACPVCLVRKAMPRPPAMGDLPLARIEPGCRPFTNCGVDYFGPITVTIGRRHEKRWVALFTCLTTRAVHLEMVASLSTDSAIMALRRMAARRGWPRVIYSDNGTNFRGADAELRAAFEEWLPALQDHAQLHRAQWRFIPPGAPNQGGAWERLVRTVKSALTATLNSRAPKEEVLTTVLVEAEHTVNARPLTHVSTDPRDEEALTPQHFLLGSSTGLPTTGPCEEADRRAWRVSQALADHFWSRWVREYLPTLVPRRSPTRNEPPLRVGDLVIVVDGTLPRNVWPRGVVTRVFPGPDGGVRSAEVRTKGGVFRRPTSRLAVLPIQREAATAEWSLRRGEAVADGE